MTAPRKAVDLFLSLGICAGLAATGLSHPPQAQAQHQHRPSVAQGEGGEGGEGGEAGSSDTVQTDLELLVVLAQMQGHLRIARELLEQGRAPAAEPHLGHPADELYGAIEPVLQQHGIAGFRSSLEALRTQARLTPRSPELIKQLTAAQQSIAAAGLGLPAALRNNPQTTMAVVRELAAAAVREYGAAEANGRIIEVIEYQDARGFLLQAQQLLTDAIASMPNAKPGYAPQFTAQLSAQLSILRALLKGLPTAIPPARSLLSPAQLQHLQRQL